MAAEQAGWLARNASPVGLIGSLLNIGNTLNTLTENTVPVLEEKVTVSVTGASNSTKTRLMQLAMAVAFGQIKNRGIAVPFTKIPPPSAIKVDYDMMGKSVTVTLQRRYSGLLSRTVSVFEAASSVPDIFDVIFGGVDEDLVAGNWDDFWFSKGGKDPLRDFAAPGGPRTLAVGSIANNDPNFASSATNPVPFPSIGTGEGGIDIGARGTYGERLVFAALAQPCANVLPVNTANQNQLTIAGPVQQISGQETIGGILGQLLASGTAGLFPGEGSGGSF